MSDRAKHSKVKNTGILFELLARQVTADTLEGRTLSPALNIIREFFKPNTELGKELVLYRAFFTTKKLTEARALKLIDMIVERRKLLDQKLLNQQKYQLVKRINEAYEIKEFLASKIPFYKVYASVYKTFYSENNPAIDISNISEVANARFTIVEHLTGKNSDSGPINNQLLESFKSQQEDLRLLSMKILFERFNDKYKNLSIEQKTLLREYINNVSNTNSLREYINTEIPKVKKSLETRISKIKNKVTQIKLQEVLSQLHNISKGKTVRDNQVSALMIAYQIIREIDKAKTL